MKKYTTLKLNKEFKRAYFQGKYKAHPLLVTYFIKNRNRQTRIGITTSKKIGCAVERNRARRIIKQAFIEIKKESNEKKDKLEEMVFSKSYDFVFVARGETPKSTTLKVKSVMKKQIEALIKK